MLENLTIYPSHYTGEIGIVASAFISVVGMLSMTSLAVPEVMTLLKLQHDVRKANNKTIASGITM